MPTVEVHGHSAKPYIVNTEELTCTCPDYRFRCSHFPKESDRHLCKHLRTVLNEHPEFAPAWFQLKSQEVAEEPSASILPDPDGKYRRPIAFFDPYVSEIKSVLRNYSDDIDRYEFCGSYRRRQERISDLDVLLIVKDGHNINDMLDYLENTMNYEKLWRGDKKASYKIDGVVQVDFKFVPIESWAFSTLHFTGSKGNNIELRKKALSLGYSLSEYGLKDSSGVLSNHGCYTEQDIYDFLGLKYVEPWNR